MVEDIRVRKRALRTQYKLKRHQMTPEYKALCDKKIYDRVINLWSFRNNETVFIYVSTDIEVDTRDLIRYALSCKKKVAVPRCTDKSGIMDFYYIDSLDALLPGSYGVLEPVVCEEKLVKDFTSGLCLVPALSFDAKGYRLGYGKGYYDRFLSSFGGETVGLCYSDCMSAALPRGRFDKALSAVVTDKSIIIL